MSSLEFAGRNLFLKLQLYQRRNVSGFIIFSYKVFGLVGVYTNTANWKKLISTVHLSLRIHIFGHATKLGCLYFGFRQSNQHRPSFKPYACIPDLFDEIALMFGLLRMISAFLQQLHHRQLSTRVKRTQEIQIVVPSTSNVHG